MRAPGEENNAACYLSELHMGREKQQPGIHTKTLNCLRSGVEFDMNDIFYEFKRLHHFQDSLTFGVNVVLVVSKRAKLYRIGTNLFLQDFDACCAWKRNITLMYLLTR